MPIDLDYNGGAQDWLKPGTIDIPERGGGVLTEATFRAWMRRAGIRPSQLRSLPLYSETNRRRYPWLERVAADPEEWPHRPPLLGYPLRQRSSVCSSSGVGVFVHSQTALPRRITSSG